MDKLVLLAKEIVTHVEELGLLCFPEAIDVDSAPLVVHWPGEDWKEFLAFVPALGVPVIYVGTTTFDYEEEDDPDELAEHDGQTDSVLVTYVAGGVVHHGASLPLGGLKLKRKQLADTASKTRESWRSASAQRKKIGREP